MAFNAKLFTSSLLYLTRFSVHCKISTNTAVKSLYHFYFWEEYVIPQLELQKCGLKRISITVYLYKRIHSKQKYIHSDPGYITSTEQASNTKDGLDKSNCHVTRKQKTVLPFQVSPIKHKPKQKHTAKLAAFMSKSNRNSISLWWGGLKGTPSCQALLGL